MEEWSGWIQPQEPPCKALLSDKYFQSFDEAIQWDRQHHTVDFMAIAERLRLDFYSWTMLVNYVRKQVQREGFDARALEFDDRSLWMVQENLLPVIQEDRMITDYSLDIENDLESGIDIVVLPEHDDDDDDEEDVVNRKDEVKEQEPREQEYFDSYGHLSIHREMLSDQPRTLAYRAALKDCLETLEGGVVLDVGCGSGILSMFAASLGAHKVYGVDYAQIVARSRHVVLVNGFADRIELIQSKVEELKLPCEQVDVIVSEWMGYFCLFESMLSSVIYARDRWLRDEGILVPNRCQIVLFGLSVRQNDYDLKDTTQFWSDVYGFDMRCLLKDDDMDLPAQAVVATIPTDTIISSSDTFLDLDLYSVTDDDLDFDKSFMLIASCDCQLNAFASHFDTILSDNVVLSTSPDTPATHWEQTIFNLPKTFQLYKDDVISGTIKATRRRIRRSYKIDISFKINGESESHSYSWVLE